MIAAPDTKQKITTSVATRNACKLCAPLGASLVFKGIKGAMPILHGSQGCATYIRRYVIGHFREPIDIASSSFTEHTAIFGGAKNLHAAIENVISQYEPSIIGIATTCLAETIGEDVTLHIMELQKKSASHLPPIVQVSTPSYKGTHMDGFRGTVHAVVKALAKPGEVVRKVALFPGMVSPADLRFLKQVCDDFGTPAILVPDYSDTLDGGSWDEYQNIPEGGTDISAIAQTGHCAGAIEFGSDLKSKHSAAQYLAKTFGITANQLPLPIGIELSDRFFNALQTIGKKDIPCSYQRSRQRLIDAYVDGHKYCAGVSAALYGEEDLIAAMACFLSEIGVRVSACLTGGDVGRLRQALRKTAPEVERNALILEESDFEDLAAALRDTPVDMMVGHSKGFSLARKIKVPLVRVGFPVHDRMGAQRIRHIGYEGSAQLYDRIVNTIIEQKQNSSEIGYLTW